MKIGHLHKTSTMTASVVGMRIVLGYLLLLSIMIIGIKAKPEKPHSLDLSFIAGKAYLTCNIHMPGVTQCATAIEFKNGTCKFKFYYGDSDPASLFLEQEGKRFTPMRNGKYYCRTHHATGGDSDAREIGRCCLLTVQPTITIVQPSDVCGKEKVEVKCTAGNSSADKELEPTVQMRIVKADNRALWLKNWTPASDGDVVKAEICRLSGITIGDYACEAQTTDVPIKGKRTSVSAANGNVAACTPCNNSNCGTGKTCDATQDPPTCVATPPTSPGTTPKGDDTTGHNNNGDSGAPNLGRPAPVLTMVCSLLALTLALRG